MLQMARFKSPPNRAENHSVKCVLAAMVCAGLIVAPTPVVAADVPSTPALTKVFKKVNKARSKPQMCGSKLKSAAKPLRYDADLGLAAQRHAQDMADNDYFEHLSLDGRTFVERIAATAYKGDPAGENLAAGQQSAREVVTAWMQSPPHCLNIMRKSFDEVGLGLAVRADERYSEPVTYWVQDFGYK